MEIISSILEAEKESEKIIENANEKAKNIILDAEVKADKIREDAITSFKSAKKLAIIDAENKARDLYYKTIQDGKNQAEDSSKDIESELDVVADKILKEIIK